MVSLDSQWPLLSSSPHEVLANSQLRANCYVQGEILAAHLGEPDIGSMFNDYRKEQPFKASIHVIFVRQILS